MEREHDTCMILTSDKGLLTTLGGKLETWGKQVLHNEPGQPFHPGGKAVVAALVDVRRNATETLSHLTGIRSKFPLAEIVLINTEGNISASMAGMRAGAGDEVTTPFDMKALKKAVLAACQRGRKKQGRMKRNPLARFFEKTMKAATFAEEGEFDTAITMMGEQEKDRSKDAGATADEKQKNN